MKIFWSWQSDLEKKLSMHFIKKCIEKAISEINSEATFSDREVEIDHDTKNIPGSPPITDTIFEKITNSDLFIADITPIAQTIKGKKVMNPNVAIEMGYATALLSHKNIITVMNGAYGTLEDLPFDLKHKRGPIIYRLDSDSDQSAINSEQAKLVGQLKTALSFYNKHKPELKGAESFSNYDKFGPAIYFKKEEPIARLEGLGWNSIRDQGFLPEILDSYFYVKIIPQFRLEFSKTEIKQKLFSEGRFKIPLLFGSPDNTPIPNKYGVILAKFSQDLEDKKISDFVQIFKNGDVVSITNSFLQRTKNKIPLASFVRVLHDNIGASLNFIEEISSDKPPVYIEIGLVNNECTIVRQNPKGNRYYPEPEVGPLEQEIYKVSGHLKSSEESAVQGLVKDLVTKMMDDIAVPFDFDDHDW